MILRRFPQQIKYSQIHSHLLRVDERIIYAVRSKQSIFETTFSTSFSEYKFVNLFLLISFFLQLRGGGMENLRERKLFLIKFAMDGTITGEQSTSTRRLIGGGPSLLEAFLLQLKLDHEARDESIFCLVFAHRDDL